MFLDDAYGNARAVESAMKSAAQSAFKLDPSVTVGERLRQERFRRFLSRVFLEEGCDFLLKGGTGILARVPNARATLDIDLFRTGHTLEESVSELRRLAEADIGDHFRFMYQSSSPILVGGEQSYSAGMEVRFDVYLGVKKMDSLKIDLAQGAGVTSKIQLQHPAGALHIPKLQSAPYRLYPVVDQIADKVCATVMKYSGRDSTREKDLVDLVVFASLQEIDSDALNLAILSEGQRRNLPTLEAFTIPPAWGIRYSRLAQGVPACNDFPTVEAAKRLMESFLDPVLAGEVQKANWNPARLLWMTRK